MTRPASACFVCGHGAHEQTGHTYWPTADAMAEARAYDRAAAQVGASTTPSMSAVETLDPREAVTS